MDDWSDCERGDWLIPLVYAAGSNDERLARALLRFARDRTEAVGNSDEAMAVLEVADATLAGDIDKDVCTSIARNLLDEAYRQLAEDSRFDHYFSCMCASSAASLAARVDDPSSMPIAVDVVRSAVALARVRLHTSSGGNGSEQESRVASEIRLLAADHVRTEVHA